MTDLINGAIDAVGAGLRIVADRDKISALRDRARPLISVIESDPTLFADIVAEFKHVFPWAGAPPGGYTASWIQQSLNAVNNEHLAVDGNYGDAVHAAVMRYQLSRKITPDDGWAGPVTCSVLFAEVTKKNAAG